MVRNPLRLAQGALYRLRHAHRQRLKRKQHWVRVVMDEAIDSKLATLPIAQLDAVEVAGSAHRGRGWARYASLEYPDFDLVHPRDVGRFDVVLCEQVLEHVSDPSRAARSLRDLGRPGALVIVTTPFLVKVHPSPLDLWRFTPEGLRLLLSSQGLVVDEVGAWGNRWCVFANHGHWRPWLRRHRLLRHVTLRNEPDSPQVVWAFCRVSDTTEAHDPSQ